jgi:hypothetical protein
MFPTYIQIEVLNISNISKNYNYARIKSIDMSDEATNDPERGIADKLGGLLAWGHGGFMILIGIIGFQAGSVLAGVIGIVFGIAAFPIIRRKIGINPPGIDRTNRARRNVLIGTGYGLTSFTGLLISLPTDSSDIDENQTQNGASGEDQTQTSSDESQTQSLEITIEDSSRTVGIDEQIFQIFYVKNTGDTSINQTVVTSINGEQIKESQAQLEPGESEKYEISISSLSESEFLTEGENVVLHESGDNQASITYTIEQPEIIYHEIGERFTVGDGEQTVEYVINEAYADEVIGGSAINIESDGIFLVIEFSLTNRGTETFSVSSGLFEIAANPASGGEQSRYEVISGNSYIAADDSIDGEPIVFEDIQPNIETDGAIAFDVPYGYDTVLVIEPAGTFSAASDHAVGIGNMPTPDET